MEVAQLELPARYAAGTHFKVAYGAAHYAGDQLNKMTTGDGPLRQDVTREDSKLLVRTLSEALCAARAMDNLLAGNLPPRRGE
jgi:hypothetical protein